MYLGSIDWCAGDSYPIELTIRDRKTGLPIDLTGCSLILSVTTSLCDDDDVVFTVDGVINPDQTNHKGELSFTPEESDTEQLAGKKLFYKIVLYDSASHKRTIKKDEFNIE